MRDFEDLTVRGASVLETSARLSCGRFRVVNDALCSLPNAVAAAGFIIMTRSKGTWVDIAAAKSQFPSFEYETLQYESLRYARETIST